MYARSEYKRGLFHIFMRKSSFLLTLVDIQLVLGNYTNVLSALGASIAAGSGVFIHSKVKTLHQKHEKLQNSIDELHEKINKVLEKK